MAKRVSRERDAEMALAQGWTGPVEWIEDDLGRDPYAFPPGTDPAVIATNSREWDHIIPRFSAGETFTCECHKVGKVEDCD